MHLLQEHLFSKPAPACRRKVNRLSGFNTVRFRARWYAAG
jgi:hypothetical protein